MKWGESNGLSIKSGNSWAEAALQYTEQYYKLQFGLRRNESYAWGNASGAVLRAPQGASFLAQGAGRRPKPWVAERRRAKPHWGALVCGSQAPRWGLIARSDC